MSVVVIGGDCLGGIEKNLFAVGVTELVHISGRKALDKTRICLPKSTAFVLVFTDYVNHGMAQNVKTLAKANEIPLIFAKRSWRHVEEKLRASKVIKG